jgi:hypothetical protein
VDPDLDRLVSDVQYERLARTYSGNGLYGDPSMPSLVYADSTGRHVKWRPHRGLLVNGHPLWFDGDGYLSAVDAAPTARVDLAVARFDRATWQVTPAIRQGAGGAGGGVAPAPVQHDDTTGAGTGIWEMPVAEITVPAGATTTTASQVKPVEWYLGPQPLSANSTAMPPVRSGQIVWQHNLARLVMPSGTAWHVVGENGPWTRLSVASGWDTTKANVYVQRRNGWTWVQALVYRASNAGTVAAGTDLTMFTLPAEYRPSSGGSIYLAGHHGDNTARLYYNGATGQVSIIAYSNPMAANQFVIMHPIAWPSA